MGPAPQHGVALVPEVGVAFITRSEANTVDVFDPGSLHRLASIPVADDADAILYLPSTKLVYVTHGDANMNLCHAALFQFPGLLDELVGPRPHAIVFR